MRRALVALVLVASSASGAGAQSDAWANKLFKGATSHDFGNVPRGTLLVHRFPFTNIYAVDLEIINIRTSCGCSTAQAGAKLVRSKDSSYIEVVMDAHKFTGPKSISIYVTVGPEYTSTATLQISANSRPDVVLNPGEVNFGLVSRGQAVQRTFDVEYAGAFAWELNGVVLEDVPLDVTYKELYRRPGQVGYRVTVNLKPTAAAGPLKTSFQLKTNDKASPVLAVAVEGNVQASLTVAPEVVSLDNLAVDETKTQQVVVRASKPFHIVAIDGLGDGITAPLPAKAATVHFLTIQCKPTKAGSLSRKLTLRTDLENNPTATVTVEAKVNEKK